MGDDSLIHDFVKFQRFSFFLSAMLALRVPLAVTRLTVHRQLHMVEREFGGRVGSNKCMAVGCFKHDVLMIQPSDHHKNLVGQMTRRASLLLRRVITRRAATVYLQLEE